MMTLLTFHEAHGCWVALSLDRCSHCRSTVPRLAAIDIHPASADRRWCFAYFSASTTPKACTHSVFTALCRSRQHCIVLAIALQYFIRALILDYNVCERQRAFSRCSGTNAVNTAKQTTKKKKSVDSSWMQMSVPRSPSSSSIVTTDLGGSSSREREQRRRTGVHRIVDAKLCQQHLVWQ